MQKFMKVAENVLSILSGIIKIASALSEFSFSSETMTLNTYRTEDYHFPGFPGGSGGGGSGGGKYHGKDISGQFLLNFNASAVDQVFCRFIPTETTVPAATSSLSATTLVLNVLNSLTQIGNATYALMAGGLSLSRIPTI